MPVNTLMQTRRGLASAWTSANPVLAEGEWGFEIDTRLAKCGNGSTAWNSLDYRTLPIQTSNSGKFLTTNGTTPSWAVIDAFPSQTDNSGKYLTTNGTITSWATVDALPSQSGNSGKYLTTNGTAASWATIVTDPTPSIFMLMGA